MSTPLPSKEATLCDNACSHHYYHNSQQLPIHLVTRHFNTINSKWKFGHPGNTVYHGLLTSHYTFAQNSALHLSSSATRPIIKSHLGGSISWDYQFCIGQETARRQKPYQLLGQRESNKKKIVTMYSKIKKTKSEYQGIMEIVITRNSYHPQQLGGKGKRLQWLKLPCLEEGPMGLKLRSLRRQHSPGGAGISDWSGWGWLCKH